MLGTQTLITEARGMKAGFLHLVGSEDWGVEINDFMSLGRDSSCSLTLADPYLSLRHARVEKNSKGFLLRDMRSRNGTFLNGVKVLEAYLEEGDRIQIGKSQLRFSYKRNLHDLKMEVSSKNPDWSKTLNQLDHLAQSDLPALILGPSGTGKELIAKSLHDRSYRRNGPFVCVNSSALSEALIESELFGHTKGSFTGATGDRKGAFEAARGGTLFLDEVGDLPLSLQPKLLRALENREIRPVGKDETINTDVRIIAATHHDLKEKVFQGTFRLDLYYRLNVLQVQTPPLSERMEDFEDLLHQFCKTESLSFSVPVIKKLKEYSWPGNIRELKNFVSKAKAYCGAEITNFDQIKDLIDLEVIDEGLILRDQSENQVQPLPANSGLNRSLLKDLEIELIRKRLIANKGNQRQTALDLGIPKSTLHDRIKAYNLKLTKAKASK